MTSYFQIVISRFFLLNINVFLFQTYLDICEVGTFFSRPRLLNVVNRFLRENFEEFSSSPTFLDLPANDVCTYLKHKNLKTKSEETVLQAAIQWCKHNQDWEKFSAMSDHIQFNLISVPTLCNLLREDSHFKSAEISRNLILKKMEEIGIPISLLSALFIILSLSKLALFSNSNFTSVGAF